MATHWSGISGISGLYYHKSVVLVSLEQKLIKGLANMFNPEPLKYLVQRWRDCIITVALKQINRKRIGQLKNIFLNFQRSEGRRNI